MSMIIRSSTIIAYETQCVFPRFKLQMREKFFVAILVVFQQFPLSMMYSFVAKQLFSVYLSSSNVSIVQKKM